MSTTTTTMTEQDLLEAPALADKVIVLLTAGGTRPPLAAAAAALALAAIAHLARCGPDAARMLFEKYYRDLERAADAFEPSEDRT